MKVFGKSDITGHRREVAVIFYKILESLSNYGGDGNENVTKGAFFGKIQIRILESENGFCVLLLKSKNGS